MGPRLPWSCRRLSKGINHPRSTDYSATSYSSSLQSKVNKSSSRRRSLRTGKAGTQGTTQLFGFAETFAETDDGDDFATSVAEFGANGLSADSENSASVDPAGALDSSSGSGSVTLLFGATSVTITETQDGFADPNAGASGSGEVEAFFDTSSSSDISPAMVIPGTVANATTTTKGTKGTKSTGGDGATAAVPGVEMVGAANGTQGVNVTAFIDAFSKADIDDTFFSTAQGESFFNGTGEATQDSTSAAGPTQDGESNLVADVSGFANSTTVGTDGFAEADGELELDGSTIGAGAAVFDNTTAVP